MDVPLGWEDEDEDEDVDVDVDVCRRGGAGQSREACNRSIHALENPPIVVVVVEVAESCPVADLSQDSSSRVTSGRKVR